MEKFIEELVKVKVKSKFSESKILLLKLLLVFSFPIIISSCAAMAQTNYQQLSTNKAFVSTWDGGYGMSKSEQSVEEAIMSAFYSCAQLNNLNICELQQYNNIYVNSLYEKLRWKAFFKDNKSDYQFIRRADNFYNAKPIPSRVAKKLNKFNFAGGKAFLYGDWKTLSDIKINDLQIRHIRRIKGYDVTEYRVKEETCFSGSLDVLDIVGPIKEDTHLVVERILKKTKKCMNRYKGIQEKTKVYMTSGGGYLEDGLELGKVLRKYDIESVIPFSQYCASSCAIAFLGAKKRTILGEGRILFHAPYTSTYSTSRPKCQKENKQLESFYYEMLGPNNGKLLYERTMSYCSKTSGWELNKDAAELFGIVN